MEVITNNIISKKFKSIPEYKIDLGLAVKIDESNNRKEDYASGGKWTIKDKTIKKYYENFGIFLSRVGKIGTLLFYVDHNIKNKIIYILHNDEIYMSQYDNSNIREFLSDLIKNVLDGNLKPYTEIKVREEKQVNLKDMTNEELADYLAKNQQ